jgi:hypothetical protein
MKLTIEVPSELESFIRLHARMSGKSVELSASEVVDTFVREGVQNLAKDVPEVRPVSTGRYFKLDVVAAPDVPSSVGRARKMFAAHFTMSPSLTERQNGVRLGKVLTDAILMLSPKTRVARICDLVSDDIAKYGLLAAIENLTGFVVKTPGGDWLVDRSQEQVICLANAPIWLSTLGEKEPAREETKWNPFQPKKGKRATKEQILARMRAVCREMTTGSDWRPCQLISELEADQMVMEGIIKHLLANKLVSVKKIVTPGGRSRPTYNLTKNGVEFAAGRYTFPQ